MRKKIKKKSQKADSSISDTAWLTCSMYGPWCTATTTLKKLIKIMLNKNNQGTMYSVDINERLRSWGHIINITTSKDHMYFLYFSYHFILETITIISNQNNYYNHVVKYNYMQKLLEFLFLLIRWNNFLLVL